MLAVTSEESRTVEVCWASAASVVEHSMADIASEAGVSRPSLYLHYAPWVTSPSSFDDPPMVPISSRRRLGMRTMCSNEICDEPEEV